MATATKTKGQEKITALYCRLSVEDMKSTDEKANDSNSIKNQRDILLSYAKKRGFLHPEFFIDDGVSGTSFDRPGFQEMERRIEAGEVSTVIVKDLSRFGRNYIDSGQYTEILYPSLGVRFISIQENVDTANNTGTELMPINNIFNEWYAAQTSKKIRAVNQMKAANGKRVGSTVPFGYRKDPDDKEKWVVDEPAAEVVKHIFALCLAGNGPMKIAKALEAERVLVPCAYYDTVGRKHSNPTPENPYRWDDSTVVHILENRQYTGCTVNFATTTISYKVHKRRDNPIEEQQIIPNTHEAIIDEATFERVQELRQHRIRPTATGRKSLFSGLVYCADCGAPLYFAASKSTKRSQEHFVCANYKSGRGECTIHFIRDVVLESLVLEAIQGLANFVRCYEPVFLYLMESRNIATQKTDRIKLQAAIDSGKRRIAEIDKLVTRIYEDNILGKLDDDRYMRMYAGYEQEQKDLMKSIADSEKRLANMEQTSTDLHALLATLREMTDITELNQTMVNKLIQRIEVHNNEKKHSHNGVKVDIYFTAVGMVSLPDEKEILRIMETIQAQHNDPTKVVRLTA